MPIIFDYKNIIKGDDIKKFIPCTSCCYGTYLIHFGNLKETTKRISNLRKSKKLTIKNLSNAIGWGEETLIEIEQQVYLPDLIFLERISDFYGVSISYLLAEEQQGSEQMTLF